MSVKYMMGSILHNYDCGTGMSSEFDIYFPKRSNTKLQPPQMFLAEVDAISLSFWIAFLSDTESFPVQIVRSVLCYITFCLYLTYTYPLTHTKLHYYI